MFEALTDKITGVLNKISGRAKISEENIDEALKEVRLSLLDADVNFRVAREFLTVVKEKALGVEVTKSVTPGQQFVKIVHDELVALMGEQAAPLAIDKKPSIIMVVGLQGSGKTTTLGKLAAHLRDKHNRKPYLVPADVYRPAAIDQLKILASNINIPAYPSTIQMDPVDIAKDAVEKAKTGGHDVLLIDTAGRLHIDEQLMQELSRMKAAVNPSEILFVADAMTGQEAVNQAKKFDELLSCTGFILTKMDGDARGGAALSIKAVTGKPLKFIGTGEKLDALEVFHPDRIASRILGMGDVLTLVEKAQEQIEKDEAEAMLKKLEEDKFTLDDFLQQMERMMKMGPMGDVLALLPGIGSQFKDLVRGEGAATLDKQLRRFRAIVQSMTPQERKKPAIIDVSRKKRIAKGSGTAMEEVNGILEQYNMMRRMMKQIGKMGLGWLFKMMMGKGGMEELANSMSPSQVNALTQKMERAKDPQRSAVREKEKEKARAKAKLVKQQKKQARKRGR